MENLLLKESTEVTVKETFPAFNKSIGKKPLLGPEERQTFPEESFTTLSTILSFSKALPRIVYVGFIDGRPKLDESLTV